MSKEEFLKLAKASYKSSNENTNHVAWRKRAKSDFGFVAGGELYETGQWEKSDLDILQDRKQPAVTFNKLEPMIEAVIGSEVNNRQEPAYMPREPGDKAVCDTATEVGKWARDQDAEEEETDKLRNALICGMGVAIHYMEYDEDPDGRYCEISVDPLGLRWDVSSRRPNLADSSWRGFVEDIPASRFKERFPKFEGEPSAAVFGDNAEIGKSDDPAKHPTDYNDPNRMDTGGPEGPEKMARVFHFQCYTLDPVYRVIAPDGSMSEPLPEEEWKRIEKSADASGTRIVEHSPGTPPLPGELHFIKQQQRRYWQGYCNGDKLVDGPKENAWKRGFTIDVLTGRREHNTNTFYGILRGGKDPQRWTNKMLSAVIYQWMTNPKGGIIYKKGTFANPEEMEKNLAKPSVSLEANQDANLQTDLYIIQPAQAPVAAHQILQLAYNAPADTTGISTEFVGLASRDQGLGLEQTRKLATMTVVAHIFSNYRKSKKTNARMLLAFMRDYFTERTMMRVVSAENRQFVPMLKSVDVEKFDVHVDQAPLTPSMQSTVYSILKDFMQFLAPSMPPGAFGKILKPFIRYSPLPHALSEEFSRAIDESSQPDPMAEKMKHAQLEELVSKAVKNQMDALLSAAKAESEGIKTDIAGEKLIAEEKDSFTNLAQTAMQMQNDKETAKEKKANGE